MRELLDKAPKGMSPLIRPEHVERFEKQHRKFALAMSCYSAATIPTSTTDRFPKVAASLPTSSTVRRPVIPIPIPIAWSCLAKRGVLTLGTDSASMGPLPDLAEPTHYAGLKYGMIWTEGATNLGALPSTGAFYCSARTQA